MGALYWYQNVYTTLNNDNKYIYIYIYIYIYDVYVSMLRSRTLSTLKCLSYELKCFTVSMLNIFDSE